LEESTFGFQSGADFSLAVMEMRMFLARFVWEFDLEVDEGAELFYGYGLVHHTSNMHMRVIPRET
jgi:hypothetical protein